MRRWDLKSAENVDYFIANSSYIAQRIKNIYKREATVIHPPADTNYFVPAGKKEDFYLTVARMVSYKKTDLIIDAFKLLPDKKLVVIGDGPDLNKIKMGAGENIKFLGYQPAETLKQYLQKAKAFIFAADEDFGITSIEAQACGTPVLAFRKGGSLETVVESKTGLFFDQQTVPSLIECLSAFEKQAHLFTTEAIRSHAEKFSEERFRRELRNFVESKYQEFKSRQQ